MNIRKANKNDLENIMNMYSSCISGMIEQGISQWDNSYPNMQIIKLDIEAETYYIAEINGKVVGGINIDSNQDKQYEIIHWTCSSNSFYVVHRLGVKKELWKKKIGKKLMIFSEKLAKENLIDSIRLDTYSENKQAINFYKNLGYKQLGTIKLKPNKKNYYCFEKIL